MEEQDEERANRNGVKSLGWRDGARQANPAQAPRGKGKSGESKSCPSYEHMFDAKVK